MRPTWLHAVAVLMMVTAPSCSTDDGAPAGDNQDGGAAADVTADAQVAGDVTEDIASSVDIAAAVDTHKPIQYACAKRAKCNRPYCEQVLIPSGTFLRGSTFAPNPNSHFPSGDERPPHETHLDAFCIDKYETTLERYEDCVQAGICSPLGLRWTDKGDHIKTTVNHYPKKCYANLDVCKHHAVNGKNYFQARAYCEFIGSRLCTEAEWERAAHGPGLQPRLHPWGNQPPSSTRVNIPSVGTGYVERVDDYAPGQTPEGIFNMAGNVYEWTRDAYAPYNPKPGEVTKNPVTIPTQPTMKVVARGSCFFTEPTRTVTERSVMHQTFDWG